MSLQQKLQKIHLIHTMLRQDQPTKIVFVVLGLKETTKKVRWIDHTRIDGRERDQDGFVQAVRKNMAAPKSISPSHMPKQNQNPDFHFWSTVISCGLEKDHK